MITSNGEITLQLRDKLAIFENFYERLYDSLGPSELNMNTFLTKVSVPKMMDSDNHSGK